MNKDDKKLFSDFMRKEYDYYLNRINICQDVVKSVILQSIATIILTGAGTWKYATSSSDLNIMQILWASLTSAFVVLVIILYSFYVLYAVWRDRRMCELKLNYIRKSYFSVIEFKFDKLVYSHIDRIRNKKYLRTFCRIRSGTTFFYQSIAIALFGIIAITIIILTLLSLKN